MYHIVIQVVTYVLNIIIVIWLFTCHIVYGASHVSRPMHTFFKRNFCRRKDYRENKVVSQLKNRMHKIKPPPHHFQIFWAHVICPGGKVYPFSDKCITM